VSTQQRNDVYVVAVDPSAADVLRRQSLIVLEANHHHFEEVLELGPEAHRALSVVYRDAFAVLDAVAGGGRRIRRRRSTSRSPPASSSSSALAAHEKARIDAAIEADRRVAKAIDGLFADAR
jgi:hypothetical protein